MLHYLKYLLQLVLSPSHGWEDLATEDPDPRRLLRRGFLPLLYLTAATEFLALVYRHDASFSVVCIKAIVDFGAYFIGYFIAKIVFDTYLPHFVHSRPDGRRSDTLAVMGTGLMVAIQLLDNVVPWNIMVLRFLPLYSVLVLHKAAEYMHVPRSRELNFLMLTTVAAVVAPLGIYSLFFFLLP